MTTLRIFFARLIGIFRRGQAERELAEELHTHLEMAVEENLQRGMPPEEARRAAQIRFGGIEQAREACRDQSRLPFWDSFFQDLRFGVRSLLKSPGFSVTALLTLALGISVNTAMFSIFNTVIFHALPFRDAGSLVFIWGSSRLNCVSFLHAMELQQETTPFTEMGFFELTEMLIDGEARSGGYRACKVSPGVFKTLGMGPMLGRWFLPEESEPGRGQAVILSHSFWKDHFGADRGLVGRVIQMNGKPCTVVGVLPPDFAVPGIPEISTQIWVPQPIGPDLINKPDSMSKLIIARIKHGIGMQRAQEELKAISRRMAAKYPERFKDFEYTLEPLEERAVGPLQRIFLVFLGAVGLILLIACANAANLQLSRNAVRQKELAIRLALGAGRLRIFQLFMTESLLLGLLAGIVGLAISAGLIRMIRVFGPQQIPRLNEVGVDWSVLVFTFLASISAGFLFGIIPALLSTKLDLNFALKSGAMSSRSGFGLTRGHRLQSLLVMSQVALTIILLVGAALLFRSLSNLINVSLGFNAKNLLAIQMFSSSLSPVESNVFFQQIQEEIKKLPNVTNAAHCTLLPLGAGGAFISISIAAEAESGEWKVHPPAKFQAVSNSYFQTMGIPVLKGRTFTQQDRAGSPPVVVVSQSLAQNLWPGRNPIGKRINLSSTTPTLCRGSDCLEVVGVVGDVRDGGPAIAPQPQLYFCYLQDHWESNHALVVRSAPNNPPPVRLILDRIEAMDKRQHPDLFGTMDQFMEDWLKEPRFRSILLGVFAGLALLLAAVGIFGATAYLVSQRTHEMGIRLALGARPGDLVKMILRYCLLVAGIGLGLGLGGAVVLTRLLRTILFEVKPLDPLSFTVAPLFLAGLALLASLIPALKAAKINPKNLLQCE